MKKIIVYVVWLGLLLSYLIKIYMSVLGNYYSQQMKYFEEETKRLQTENAELEKEANKKGSLQYALKKAKEWGYTEDAATHLLIIK